MIRGGRTRPRKNGFGRAAREDENCRRDDKAAALELDDCEWRADRGTNKAVAREVWLFEAGTVERLRGAGDVKN